MRHLAFVAPPFAGHFNPLLALALTARDAGHETRFVTGPRKFAVLERHRIPAVKLHSIGPDTLERIANTGQQVGSNPLRLLAQFRQNLQLLPAIRIELLALWRDDPPSAVIADSVAPVAGLAAMELGIPWITTIATPFSIEARTGTPSYCGGWMPGSRVRDAAGHAVIRTFKHSVAWMFRSELRALGLRGLYRDTGEEAIYSPQAILGFGIRELEFARDWPSTFEMIGPVIDSPEPAPALHSHPRPRVLVTHGTHLLWAKRQLLEESQKVARTLPHVHFVLSMGEPERAPEPAQQLRPNLTVYPFVSYAAHMAEFDAVVHHGGAGVTYAAILAGVPSLAVPRDYDQFDYAARIVHHGLGLRARSINAGAIERLLNRNQWPALSTFQAHARAYDPRRRFLEVLSRFV